MFVEILPRYNNILCHIELVGCNWVNSLGAMHYFLQSTMFMIIINIPVKKSVELELK